MDTLVEELAQRRRHGLVPYALALVLAVAPTGLSASLKPIDDRAFRSFIERTLAKPPVELTIESPADLLRRQAVAIPQCTLAAESSQQLAPSALYAKCVESVLVLATRFPCKKCKRRHAACGTAFAIADNLLATCRHVLKETGEGLVAVDRQRRLYPVRQARVSDQARDLAVLVVDGPRLKPLPLARSPIAPGSAVMVVHHPANHFYVLTHGMASRRSIANVKGQKIEMLELTAAIARGSSGAPVLDSRGNVVGIAKSTRTLTTEKKGGKVQMVIRSAISVKYLHELVEAAMKGVSTSEGVAAQDWQFGVEEFVGEEDPILTACRRAGRMGRRLAVWFWDPANTHCAQMEVAISSLQAQRILAKSFALLSVDREQHADFATRCGFADPPLFIVFKGDREVVKFADEPATTDELCKLLRESLRLSRK